MTPKNRLFNVFSPLWLLLSSHFLHLFLTFRSCLTFVSWFYLSLLASSFVQLSLLCFVNISCLAFTFCFCFYFLLLFFSSFPLFAYAYWLAFASCFYFSLLTFGLWLAFVSHFYPLFLAFGSYLALASHFCLSLHNFIFAFHFWLCLAFIYHFCLLFLIFVSHFLLLIFLLTLIVSSSCFKSWFYLGSGPGLLFNYDYLLHISRYLFALALASHFWFLLAFWCALDALFL